MLKTINTILLAILCLAASQLSLMESYVFCIAGDGCVSITTTGHDHHHCDEEVEVETCGCGHHHESSEDDSTKLSASDCIDLEVEFSEKLNSISTIVSIPVYYVAPTNFELPKPTTVYKAPTWCRQLIYPPPIIDHLRSTIILC